MPDLRQPRDPSNLYTGRRLRSLPLAPHPPSPPATHSKIARSLDSQSIATTGLDETRALMALHAARANPAPPSHNHIPASSLGIKVDDARKGVLSVLKVRLNTHPIGFALALINTVQDTGWPPKAMQDVQDFIQTMETGPGLHRIPKEDTQMQGELRIAIEHFLKCVGFVYTPSFSANSIFS